MADPNKKDENDIFIAQSIYPEAASIFTAQLKSLEEIKDDCYIVMPCRIVCNDMQWEGVKISPDLASRLLC